ncbi:Transposon Ty3-G Gag-Pol polyprotein [Pelomyxa schiedti]|nr:Transposon Ty3-G Gag-Pol polyprotein [Pelomyxa schiedti]
MQEQEYPCPKVARWQMVLDDYGAVVEFRPGKESGDADALSRIPSHALMVIALGDSLHGWKGAQDKDEDCQAIAEWVGSGKSLPDRLLKKVPPRESSTIEQGVLYYLETDHNRRRRVKADVVPKELQHQVMEDNHDSIFTGHLSAAYTWDRVRAHFWWPRARTDVNYCESCRQCAVAKTPAHRSCAVGHPLPVPSRPGVVMSLDYVGPLRMTKCGHAYILVMIDHFSGDVELKVTKHPDAESAVRVVRPRLALHQQGDGGCVQGPGDQTEIHNPIPPPNRWEDRAIQQGIGGNAQDIYTNWDKNNWDELLPMLAFAYCTATSRTTGFSPFFLEHGRDARSIGLATELGVDGYTGDHAERLTKRVREAWKTAQRTAELARQAWDVTRMERTDATQVKYKVGDLVYVLRNGGHKDRELGKLGAKWKGPYRIVAIPVEGAARLEDLEGGESHKLINLGQLCKCHERLAEEGGEVHRRETADFAPTGAGEMTVDEPIENAAAVNNQERGSHPDKTGKERGNKPTSHKATAEGDADKTEEETTPEPLEIEAVRGERWKEDGRQYNQGGL